MYIYIYLYIMYFCAKYNLFFLNMTFSDKFTPLGNPDFSHNDLIINLILIDITIYIFI